MVAVQLMCARLGMVTGRGLAGMIRLRYPRPVLWGACTLLVVANVINIAADLAGMAEVTGMVTGTSSLVWTPAYAAIIISMLFWSSYKRIARIFKWLTLVLFAYVAAGDDVIGDPSGRRLVIARGESSRITLWRRTLEGGSGRRIPMDSAAPLLGLFVSPGTIHPDGRMLVSLNLDSWFNPPALLDMASGRVTRLLDNRQNDYHSLAWMPDGQIVATQQSMRATIWKFTPERK